MSNVELNLSSNMSWLLHRLVLWNWTEYTSNVNSIKSAVVCKTEKYFKQLSPCRVCLNVLSGLFSQLLVLAVTRRRWWNRMRHRLPWQTRSQEPFVCRSCDIIAFISFSCWELWKMCKYLQTDKYLSWKHLRRKKDSDERSYTVREHDNHTCVCVLHVSTVCVWIAWVCTFENTDILVMCVQSSAASHRVVWLEVTNETPSILSAVSFVRLVRVCSFWSFHSFIPLHLIPPVTAAELLSPCFHTGPVHRDD